MIRIGVAGLKKDLTEKTIIENGNGNFEVLVTTDMDAAKKIKKGELDYYFGACNSGGGAAISILIGMIGYGKCSTVAKAGGNSPEKDQIKKLLDEGKIAFGMSVENIEKTVPVLLESILESK